MALLVSGACLLSQDPYTLHMGTHKRYGNAVYFECHNPVSRSPNIRRFHGHVDEYSFRAKLLNLAVGDSGHWAAVEMAEDNYMNGNFKTNFLYFKWTYVADARILKNYLVSIS